jgi:Ca-activated chloride channel family protein
MRFANPDALWALLALPVLALLVAWGIRRRRAMLGRFASLPLALAYLAPRFSPSRLRGKGALLVAAAACLAFAAARPQWGFEDRKMLSRGIDMIVAVDTSLSMLAQDYKPDRLARAKELLQDIIWSAKGDRLGVIAFAGDAYVMCPLTLDYSMASSVLKSLSVNTVPVRGTNVAGALNQALNAFATGSGGERVLVLLTDGEDHGGAAIDAAERAAKEKVKVYTIGIGTSNGMPIPLPDGSYKQDREGKIVSTKLDFSTLTKISQLTGGKAVRAQAGGSADLQPVLADIEKMQKVNQQDTTYRVWTERFQWFLGPAIILLVLEALVTDASRRRRIWKGRLA